MCLNFKLILNLNSICVRESLRDIEDIQCQMPKRYLKIYTGVLFI
jgi:hypothetical protein